MAVEIEFRDGTHAVPNHVAAILRLVDTTTMTHDEAIKASQNQLLKDHLNMLQRKVVARHFRQKDSF